MQLRSVLDRFTEEYPLELKLDLLKVNRVGDGYQAVRYVKPIFRELRLRILEYSNL